VLVDGRHMLFFDLSHQWIPRSGPQVLRPASTVERWPCPPSHRAAAQPSILRITRRPSRARRGGHPGPPLDQVLGRPAVRFMRIRSSTDATSTSSSPAGCGRRSGRVLSSHRSRRACEDVRSPASVWRWKESPAFRGASPRGRAGRVRVAKVGVQARRARRPSAVRLERSRA